jgi:hypothetical protein
MRHALRLEIPAETLLRLLASGQLCAADIRCLDCDSKQCLWRLLLMSVDRMINVVSGCNGRCSECGKKRTGTDPGLTTAALAPSPSRVGVIIADLETTGCAPADD